MGQNDQHLELYPFRLVVAVDTAKTLKMEWEGWEGWESRVWVVAVDTAKTHEGA